MSDKRIGGDDDNDHDDDDDRVFTWYKIPQSR